MTWTTRRNPYVLGGALLQLFALVRCAMAIAGDEPHDAWLFGCLAAVLVPFVAVPLIGRAVARGHNWAWGGLAVVGLAGLIVVWLLPDRTGPAAGRGFPIEPHDPAGR